MWPPVNNPYNVKPTVGQDIYVGPGDYIVDPESKIPGCGDQRDKHVQEEVTALSTALIAGAYPALSALAPVGGALAGQLVSQLQAQVGKTGGFVSTLLFETGYSPRYANCGTVTLVVPDGYHITKIMPRAMEGNDFGNLDASGRPIPFGDCAESFQQYEICAVGWSAWTFRVQGNVVVAVFKNWSGDRTRLARFVVEFDR